MTPLERLWLWANLERARQLQVHTAAEASRVAAGEPGSLAYYDRWGNARARRDEVVLDAFHRRRKQ